MNTNIIKFSTPFFSAILLLMLTLFSCTKDEVVYEQTRLFRPVLNGDLKAEGNKIIINLLYDNEH